MRKALLVIAGVVVVGSVLGATVFRENIARAAAAAPPTPPTQPVIVTNAVDQAVPVREVNAAQQPEPAFFDGISTGSPIMPAVPAGKRFIITWVNYVVGSTDALVCHLWVEVPAGNLNVASFVLHPAGGLAVANEQVFIPVEAGRTAVVNGCGGANATVRIGGYFIPAS